jgi:hypothetical protein
MPMSILKPGHHRRQDHIGDMAEPQRLLLIKKMLQQNSSVVATSRGSGQLRPLGGVE